MTRLLALLILTGMTHQAVAEPPAPAAEAFLLEGKLVEGERALIATVKEKPDDSQARFGLGVVQFVRAIERRMQAFHRYGYRTDLGGAALPFRITNLPIRDNPTPEALDYATARSLLKEWNDDLRKTEETLAGIKDPGVKLPLHFAMTRLDFDGDGKSDARVVTLWKIYSRFNRRGVVEIEIPKTFVIAFDRGDVDWLRGYCHMLMTLSDFILAHDFEELFVNTGHVALQGRQTALCVSERLRRNDPERSHAEIALISSR